MLVLFSSCFAWKWVVVVRRKENRKLTAIAVEMTLLKPVKSTLISLGERYWPIL
jgi:hypothetical protein